MEGGKETAVSNKDERENWILGCRKESEKGGSQGTERGGEGSKSERNR